MNKNVKELVNKVCAIFVIIALTISDFLLVGQSVVSYALDAIETNNTNVDFVSYFLDEEGNKVNKIEKNIKEGELTLYTEISVKNEGYFNGSIYLKNNNFNIKQENESSDISEITDNKVILNQINAGSTVTLKLEVEPIIEDIINTNILDSETDVMLEGKYINSKNVEKNKSIEINGTSKVEVNWKSSNEINADLSANVLTNSIYNVNGEEKRVVQILVNSKALNNEYPVKNTEILFSVPNKTDNVTIHARSTEATNANTSFSEDNYSLDVSTNTVTVKVSNEDEKISWKKNVQDTFVVTYYMDKDEDISNTYVQIDSKILTYDNKELKQSKNVYINENIQEIISYSKLTQENNIYKGKIYTGEEREYTTSSQINVNFETDVKSISIKENEAKYLSGENEITANITYKTTKINKEEFINLFGEEGNITVKDSNQNIIANITKDTETDEDGNIIIKYQPDVKSIEFITTKPVVVGTLNLIHTKVILNSNLSREEVKNLTGIKETLIGLYNENEYSIESKKIIELKNTTSKASLSVNTDKLSSTEKNENVRITAVLENNDESKDLYKNPIIKITMPEKVTGFSAKCKLLYGNGLTLNKAEIISEERKSILQIALEGEQTTYNTEAVQGTTLVIYANIDVDRLAINGEEEIKLNYTNEIATDFEDNGEQIEKIKIMSTEGVITTNTIEALGIRAIGEQETKQINIPVSRESKDLAVEIGVINNEGAEIKDVKIMGTFPTKTDDNLGINLTSGLKLISANETAQIYYSDKEKVTDDLTDSENRWSKQGNSATTKSYLIKIDTMKIGEEVKAVYNLNIPEDLNYNLQAQEGYKVSYKNATTEAEKTVNATTLNMTTGIGPNIELDIKATVGNELVGEAKNQADKDGMDIVTGEIIKYDVTLKNTGSEVATNLQIEEIAPDNTTLLRYGKEEQQNNKEGLSSVNVNTFKKIEEKSQIINIDTLDIGETKTISLYLKANKVENIATITNQINIRYKDKIATRYITNKINTSDITNIGLKASDINSDEESLQEGKQYQYSLDISGLASENIDNIDIQFLNNELFEINKIEYYDLGKSDNEEYTGTTEEKSNKIKLKIPRNINIFVTAKRPTENIKDAELYAIITENKHQIRTNKITKEVKAVEKVNNTTIELDATNAGENVGLGQEIDYTIKIENSEDGINISNIKISDYIANELDIKGLEYNGNVVPQEDYYISMDEDEKGKVLNYSASLNKGEKANLVVKTEVNNQIESYKDIELVNTAKATIENELEINTDKVIHLLGATAEDAVSNPDLLEEDNEDEEEDSNTDSESKINANPNTNSETIEQNMPETKNSTNTEQDKQLNKEQILDTNTVSESKKDEKTYTISGTAWLDANEDGKRDSQETRIKDVKVLLVDTKTNAIAIDSNNQEITTLTDEKGFYAFSKIPQGRYIVAFEYDTEKYVLTPYQEEGVTNTQNSDVERATVTLSGKNYTVGLTDNIEITDSSKSNIDIGLVEAKIFDLNLSKTVTKLTVSNKEGTTSKEYDGKTLAKTEIDAKYLSESTVVIEYKVTVTNEGEVAGYAKNIVDYKPKDLSFNSSLNPDWYQSGDYLYSSSLANTKLQPGESKEITLVLTKKMTETNTGLVNNTAEIQSDYNKLGIADTDSVAGNKKSGEDDMSSANVIISVKTGVAVNYVALTLSIIIIIAGGIYVISKKVLKEEIEF